MAQKKSYKFSALKAEANKGRKVSAPFVIDDVVPKITIKAPTSTEQSLRLASLVGTDGGVSAQNVKPAFEAVCGDAFPRVWDLIKGEDLGVAAALLGAIMEHFGTDLDAEAADVPGGSVAS